MADRSRIEWCDSTFNPWIGCTKISPACDNCYAAVSTPARVMGVAWGTGESRQRTSPGNWKLPLRWQAQHEEFFAEHGHRRRVFCASLADVFDNEVSPHWRYDLFNLIHATPDLDWLLLTKRIGNARQMLNDAAAAVCDDFCGAPTWEKQPWPNVWLGVTVCNQVEAERDIPKLLTLPASRRFVSMEPLLGPVHLVRLYCVPSCAPVDVLDKSRRCKTHAPGYCLGGCEWRWPALDWVIVGGESGPRARPIHPDWVRAIRDQCAKAGVPFLFKQWGEWQIASLENGHTGCHMPETGERYTWVCIDGRTSNPSANGLAEAYAMARVGKKAAGRLLDGVQHNNFPEAP